MKTPTQNQLIALGNYRRAKGSNWMQELMADWMTGKDVQFSDNEGHLLRQLRNQFGPAWLVKYAKQFETKPTAKPTAIAELIEAKSAVVTDLESRLGDTLRCWQYGESYCVAIDSAEFTGVGDSWKNAGRDLIAQIFDRD